MTSSVDGRWASADDWLRRALNLGREEAPMPLLRRLLLEYFRVGKIPREIEVPGIDRTDVMAAWLVGYACGAPIPRRLVWVLAEQTVIDSATDVAEHLRQLVTDDSDLRHALGLGDEPLPISTFRGRYCDSDDWLDDPASPAIIINNVETIGSRLLFEGKGVNRKKRPWRAALLGVGSLFVLADTPYMRPFEKLIEQIATNAKAFGPRVPNQQGIVPSALKVMSFSKYMT